MIEFYIIGSLISFYKFNQYINNKFEHDIYDDTHDTTCKTNGLKIVEKNFSRFEFLSVFMYNFVYTLFVMIIFIYGVYLIEFFQWFFLNNNDTSNTESNYTLLKELAMKSGKYNQYIEQKNLFISSIFKVFFVSLMTNFVFINLLILFRGSTTEKNKKKAKLDYLLLIFFILSTSVLTFIFV
jgi:hypothetical protein